MRIATEKQQILINHVLPPSPPPPKAVVFSGLSLSSLPEEMNHPEVILQKQIHNQIRQCYDFPSKSWGIVKGAPIYSTHDMIGVTE